MAGEEFCPYVGLRPYTAAEQAYFFGRQRDQRIIAANLVAAPLTVFYGPSAVGKSSVLQAGVVPQMALEAHTAIVYFSTWQDVSHVDELRKQCRQAVTTVHGAALAADNHLPLDEWLAAVADQFRGTLLMVLDQFEEYLLYHKAEDESSFDAELARIVNRRDVQANVLIGIREDGLFKLDRFKKRIPNLLGNTLRLQRLSPLAAREAITGPVRVYNQTDRGGALPMEIEEALIDEVIEQVRADRMLVTTTGGTGAVKVPEEGSRIETALLQMVMTRLWREPTVAGATRVMRAATLHALGGAQNIVKLHLNEVMDQLPAQGRAIAADLFQQLVTPTGAKVAHTTEDLILFAHRPAQQVLPVLEHLAQARLLRRVDPGERYEIFHDALSTATLDWRAIYLQNVARQTAVVEAAKRRNKRLALALVSVAILAVTGFAWRERREARRQGLLAAISVQEKLRAEQGLEAAQIQIRASAFVKEEADQTIAQKGLEVDALRAELTGQTARAADLKGQAQAAQTRAVQARQTSADLARQAQVKLQAADDTQKQIEALNSELKKTGFSGDYKAVYRQAANARDRRQWNDAARLFESAASIKPDSGETITMPGFGADQPYLPYYELGVARQNLKDCPGALKAWESAEQAGAVTKAKEYSDLQKRRGQCGGK